MLEELEEQQKPRARVTNPIVLRVLEQVSASIGVDLGMEVQALTFTQTASEPTGVDNVIISSINEDSASLSELFHDLSNNVRCFSFMRKCIFLNIIFRPNQCILIELDGVMFN
jgi:hypothetical protein